MLAREIEGQAARLPRQRRDRRRSRRAVIEAIDSYYRQLERQHPPQHARARRRGRPSSTRAARAKVARFDRRASARRSCSCATRPRRSTSCATPGRASTSAPGDVVLITRDGAPLERRAVAAAVRGAGRAARVPVELDERGPARPRRARRAARGRQREAGRGRPRLERARARSTRSRRSSQRAHAAGATGPGRRRPGGAADAGRRRRRPAPTSTPSPATRCSGRPGIGVLWARRELLEEMPPFLGGGSMIKRGRGRPLDLGAAAGEVRGRHARDRGGASGSAPRSTTCRTSAWTPCARTSAS